MRRCYRHRFLILRLFLKALKSSTRQHDGVNNDHQLTDGHVIVFADGHGQHIRAPSGSP